MRNMKGEWCPYDGRFCQEGWCEDCCVYLKYKKRLPEKLEKENSE